MNADGIWRRNYALGGMAYLIVFVIGSICLGTAIQWIWIEKECGLDNLWMNTVKKCQDNRLRLALGGPLVLVANLIILWLGRFVLYRHVRKNRMRTTRGFLLALSAPGIVVLVLPAGVRWLGILATFVVAVELFIYFRYLHGIAIRIADSLLGYFAAGVFLQAEGTTLIVRLSKAPVSYEWLIARRRILASLKSQKFVAIDVTGVTPQVSATQLISWLQKIAKKGAIQLNILDRKI